MKCLNAFLAICTVSLVISSSVSAEKYYSFDKAKTLTLKESVVLVEMKDKYAKLNMGDVSGSVERIEDYGKRFLRVHLQPGKRDKAVKKIKELNNVKMVFPVYQNDGGLEMALTDRIVVTFKNDYSAEAINNLISTNDLKVISQRGKRYVFEVLNNTSALDMANKVMEQGNAVYSHPDFICEITKFAHIPNDEYFGWQWNFHNVGQTLPNEGHVCTNDADIDAPEAWDITLGSNEIIVAVLDEGVTSDHPDLPNTRQIRLKGSNFGAGDPDDPSPTGSSNHGNSCAGLVGATQDNNQGVTGVAPNVRIMPIRLICVGVSNADIADAFYLVADSGADVISNSWGYTYSTENDTDFVPDVVTAIDSVTRYGRNGKGSVVVFATGNTAHHENGRPGHVMFPANALGNRIITVGASNRMDTIANYSPISPRVDLVAPSHHAYPIQIPGEDFEIWTIDIPGDPGYNFLGGDTLPSIGTNNLSYTGRFGGTSAACPQVAGVAALLLSLDSNLTPLEVYDTLTGTADKVGGYTYTDGRCDQMGFGRLNAFSAVSSLLPEGNDVFGFEDAGLWHFIFGSGGTLSNDTNHTEGLASMSVGGNGWQQFQSIDMNTVDINETSSTINLDFFVGSTQPDSNYVGDVQFYINCPSAGIYNQWIGIVLLTTLPHDVFSTISFTLPTNVLNVLAGSHNDFSISFSLNTNHGSGPYYFDNLRFVP
ncbi:MAG: S8 family serine peptidase [Fibrobacter sp.]|nr:S8 family serine peptidase [Fibrobacter sp.]